MGDVEDTSSTLWRRGGRRRGVWTRRRLPVVNQTGFSEHRPRLPILVCRQVTSRTCWNLKDERQSCVFRTSGISPHLSHGTFSTLSSILYGKVSSSLFLHLRTPVCTLSVTSILNTSIFTSGPLNSFCARQKFPSYGESSTVSSRLVPVAKFTNVYTGKHRV